MKTKGNLVRNENDDNKKNTCLETIINNQNNK